MTWTTRRRSDLGPLAAITAGDGPTILMIHGVGLRAEAWGAQIDALAKDHRVIAVDVPGHGFSAPLGTTPDLPAYTEAVAECLSGPSVVIGHSFGAMIALDLAIRHPQHVTGVVALNAIFRRNAEARRAVLARARSLDGVTVADPEPPLDRWFGAEPSPERMACKDWLLGVDQAGYKAAYTVFAQEDGPAEASLRTLSCPALFMTGAEEPNSTPEMSRSMAAHTPDGTAIIIEGAAHMMPMTHPHAVNTHLAAFAKACTT
ncbi:alpha/beta fold hydrolase [Tateyamaria armeniaca]|uniref:Alpha/beta fold hydrolase n=1 Tax=Tateyamaria armeniaca TaxID=2518930 RepID=A0ABW8V1F3_9RHOB